MMKINLKVWRQKGPKEKGAFETLVAEDVSEDMSFLEMLDTVNEKLVKQNKDPIAFDHDCREGICGACSMVINGNPHGPEKATTTCQLHMRSFKDGDSITIEPFRAKGFPMIKDLAVNRQALDRIMISGGFVSVNTGNAQDANNLPIGKESADEAFDSAACIGCGACVAVCKNASAMLFVAAKVSHLSRLPQGQVERKSRVKKMLATMEAENFGGCTNTGACSLACPKEIKQADIARLNSEYLKTFL